MQHILVLGAGMVGSVIARDLAEKYEVSVADINKNTLKTLKKRIPQINTLELDSQDAEALSVAVQPFDMVVCAVPGHLGFNTLKNIILAEKNVVDISFAPENCLELDYLAKQNNVIAVIDAGVAPGMDNILLGFHNTRMQVERFECLVGGLPKVRKKPFEYKAPFSPIDVIEEYTRPARFIAHGRMVTREALSDRELIEFEKIGTLEAFNTDGLRSLMFTMEHIPNMKEKTLRYPGHVDSIKTLRASGFFSKEPITVNGMQMTPLEVTSEILINEWKLKPKEEEFTIMKVTIQGQEGDKHKEYIYTLYDEYDKVEHETSMARTTGFTATAIAQLILKDKFAKKGVFAPEQIGGHADCCNTIIDYLAERRVRYRLEENVLST